MVDYFITVSEDGRPTGFWDTSVRPAPTAGIFNGIKIVERKDNFHGKNNHSGIKDAVVNETPVEYIKVTKAQFDELRSNQHTRAFKNKKVIEVASNDPLRGYLPETKD